MKPTDKQIEEAIDNFSEYRECLKKCGYDAEENSGHIYEAALFALRFLQKAMGEPSEESVDAAIKSWGVNGKFALVTHFRAMRDQMLKEVVSDE